jgi:hypothetical protein
MYIKLLNICLIFIAVASPTFAQTPPTKAEIIPGFSRHATLPMPVRGIKFDGDHTRIMRAAQNDLALAYVMAMLTKTSTTIFTGAGGGKVYLPADEAALTAFINAPIGDEPSGLKRSAQLTEWQYSARFDAQNTVKSVNIMIRELTGKPPTVIEGSTRLFTVDLAGDNSNLVFATASSKSSAN